MPSKITWHGCEHAYQDEKFGKHMRMMNPTKDPHIFRCTVCGGEVITSKALKKEKKKEEN